MDQDVPGWIGARTRVDRALTCYVRSPERRNQGTPVAADKPRQPGTRKRKGRQAGAAGALDLEAARQPGRGPRLVDVDPWAILLEQLMDVPDEADQDERKPSKAK